MKKNKPSNNRPKWMQDRDLAKVIILLLIMVLGLSLALLDISIKLNPKPYIKLLYPFIYIFNLYQSATPGEKLSAIFFLLGGIGGWFLKKLMSKKE